MDSSKVQPGETSMTKAERQASYEAPVSGAAILMASAGLLILLGIVFQLAELGYGHMDSGNWWLLSVLASNLWNVLAAHVNLPALEELLRFWPLLLVCTGSAMLLAVKQGNQRLAKSSSRKENAYGE
jgi:hypothetical protein